MKHEEIDEQNFLMGGAIQCAANIIFFYGGLAAGIYGFIWILGWASK